MAVPRRAQRSRGHYFATQGFATLDINWLGRPLEMELDPGNSWGTNWGKVDPTHAGGFYPYALRDEFKYSLLPDEHSVDPILSPRNSAWFILSLAGRRALTFLEQRPEVDPEKLGFAGYSMGGGDHCDDGHRQATQGCGSLYRRHDQPLPELRRHGCRR